jgi:hypothetical protein
VSDLEGAMRITLLLLAAGVSVAASGAAAAAEIARGSMVRSGSPHGTWKPGGFGHGFKGMRPHGPHHGAGHDRRDRHRGHHRSADANILYPYGGGIAYSYEAVDPHGGGFFAGGGGEVRVRGGRPYYDYDRSYPYEWAPAARGGYVWTVEEGELEAPPQCGLERGVRVCRGGR